MTTTIKTVALAGANGSMGKAALEALLDANFKVTALTRPDSAPNFPAGVEVAKVDYDDTDALAAVLRGQDALISTVGYAGMLSQKHLIDAAIASGVKRILPSEYGADPEDASVRQLPVFAHKLEVEQYLKQKIAGTATSYTLVANNQFFDWDLDNNFGVNIRAKTMEVFDGGDIPYTVTPLDFVARSIVSVLQHPEVTANRAIRLHGTTMTQNRLLETLQRFAGGDGWGIKQSKTADREREGYEALQRDPANFVPWAYAFLQVSIWAQKYGGDFSHNNHNELLGLKELSSSEVEEIIQART